MLRRLWNKLYYRTPIPAWIREIADKQEMKVISSWKFMDYKRRVHYKMMATMIRNEVLKRLGL